MVENIVKTEAPKWTADALRAGRVIELNNKHHDIRNRLHTERFGYSLGEYWGRLPGFNRALGAAEPERGDGSRADWIAECSAVRERVHKEIYRVTREEYRAALTEVNYAAGVFAAANGLDWVSDRSLLLNGKTG